MKTFKIKHKNYLLPFAYSLLLMAFFTTLIACGNKEKTENIENPKVESKEAESTIASLSVEQIKTVDIQYGNIEQKQLSATLKVNGALRVPNNYKANVTSLYGGVIKTINVQLGDFVKKGQVIATIANPQFIQLQEEYLSTTSKIIFSEQEVARQKELNEGNAGALKNYQSANAELKSMRTRRASLQQQIQLMGINPNSLNNSNLRSALSVTSPISGTISNVYSNIGSYVDVSSPLAEIVDNSQLHLDLNIFEKDLPLIKIGQIIHFRITNNSGEDYNAKVYSIGAAFENESKSIPIHATVQGNKSGLIDGMNITAIVSLNDVTTTAIPNEAIVSTDGKDYIFVVINKQAEKEKPEGAKVKNENIAKSKVKEPENVNFEKIEVAKGVSNMGYTAITLVKDIPANAKIVIKGAFFVNAKLTNKGEEE
ncbi:efflux RND transporter periplasmic adaptor subunit [Flavobacterium cellulosilyticum]|uniref:Efflux RND transporter periplasmic adaptor subunit n=1 Tax=Flavobacterium cellulosilyticum TaxID=2541731 RepID=A0A4R5CHC2_9FLAO|nr:efflux RND transporter periplasmic adaptor subunit [Flavobacterium cellulosilyticum]TDD97910.1 efflux RND transporter periplasmic adaptor subunit [Flavobacterium cellulosilyticum]